MSEQLARMIAHTEYTQQASHTASLDFERREDVETHSWAEQGLNTLRRLLTNRTHQPSTTRETPLSDNC